MNIRFGRRKIIFLVVLAVLMLLGVGLFFVCQPLLKAMDQDRDQEKAYVQETSFVRGLLATRKTTGLFTQLVPKDKVSAVMESINKLAEKDAVKLALVRPPFVDQDNGENFQRVLFDMQAAATLKDMGVFLTGVRNMPEGLLDIEGSQVLPDEGRADMVKAKITFVLLVARDNGQK